MTEGNFNHTLFPFSASINTNQEAKILIDQARQAFNSGKTEVNFGEELERASLENEAEPNSQLAAISAWHYGQALTKFREAVNKFEEAKRFSLSLEYKNYIELKIRQCLENIMICKVQQQKYNYGKTLQ